jgi:signal transduction histidine kinase
MTNYLLLTQIGFNQEIFIPFTLFLIFGGLLLYKFLSRSIFDEIFKSDKEIDDMVKKTLHELNTPVATIQMNNKLLEKNISNEKDIKRLKRIDEACNNLLKLYEHMEYEITAKIDKIEIETFDIKEVIENSIKKI